MERLNSYQKRIAMYEQRTPKIKYVAECKALKEETQPLFDAYEAPTFNQKKFLNFDGRTMARIQEKHERFNRIKPLTMEYTFHYNCEHETEDERLKIVHDFFRRKINEIYRAEAELFKKLGGQLKENEDYSITITKIIL
ncbi:hypothetical protein [Lysinibacillus sphaericus]|uniref:Uncharacterized protein n=1 Tax=Lysinibacillus sphaericus OT4b.31 TaxID=1285586 RepID=R7ZIP8_LYSSH|nr:hypothetical protein [Lysinibacillus sphaericus]EON73958.1 hypothetical protein H131_04824 [Lysinibacillus sphaericus OT4b.31]